MEGDTKQHGDAQISEEKAGWGLTNTDSMQMRETHSLCGDGENPEEKRWQ